jgi:hypothetical protein
VPDGQGVRHVDGTATDQAQVAELTGLNQRLDT